MPLKLLFAGLAALLLAAPAHAAPWFWPVAESSVAARFHYDHLRPFDRGERRGARLAGAPGSPVRAVCAGRVAFAGALPAMGKGVTIRCGSLAATEIGLAGVTVRRGARVRRGDRLGTLASRGLLHLGARVAARPGAYRDPLALLGVPDGRRDVPLGAPPRGRALPAITAPQPVSRPLAAPLHVSPLLIALTWLGLGLLGAAVGAGIALRSVRRSRRARVAAVRGTH